MTRCHASPTTERKISETATFCTDSARFRPCFRGSFASMPFCLEKTGSESPQNRPKLGRVFPFYIRAHATRFGRDLRCRLARDICWRHSPSIANGPFTHRRCQRHSPVLRFAPFVILSRPAASPLSAPSSRALARLSLADCLCGSCLALDRSSTIVPSRPRASPCRSSLARRCSRLLLAFGPVLLADCGRVSHLSKCPNHNL